MLNPFAVSAITDTAGAASVAMPVPVERILLHTDLFVQWFLLDDQGALFGLLSSTRAAKITIGG